MKILISSASYFFSDHRSGGENRVVAGIVKELDRRGHQLYVFAPKHDIQGNLPKTRLYQIGGYTFDPVADYFGYKFNWWFYNIRSFLSARRLLRRTHIDLVHHIRPAFLNRISLCSLLPVPFVYGPITPVWENTTEQDQDLFSPPQRVIWKSIALRLLRLFEKKAVPYFWNLTLQRAAAILVQIPKALQGIPENHRDKTHMVGLGTDTTHFEPSAERFNRPTVLFLAQLNRKKGLEFLLNALPAVAARVPDVCLKVVGDGPARSYYQEIANALNLPNCVEFVGAVPHSETISYYQKSHVYCLPSVGEPAANTLLEAMACGLPIVSTESGGVPDIIAHGKAGLLVPPRNADALANALIDLLTNPALCSKISEYNRTKSVEEYDIRRLADRIERIYTQVCRSHASHKRGSYL